MTERKKQVGSESQQAGGRNEVETERRVFEVTHTKTFPFTKRIVEPWSIPSLLLAVWAQASPQGAGVTLHLWSEQRPSVCQYKLGVCVLWKYTSVRRRARVSHRFKKRYLSKQQKGFWRINVWKWQQKILFCGSVKYLGGDARWRRPAALVNC